MVPIIIPKMFLYLFACKVAKWSQPVLRQNIIFMFGQFSGGRSFQCASVHSLRYAIAAGALASTTDKSESLLLFGFCQFLGLQRVSLSLSLRQNFGLRLLADTRVLLARDFCRRGKFFR